MPASILLVEDDQLFRETVRDTLLAAGYATLEAGDGLEALDCIRQHRPDLVLLDFDLPRMMGDEALERMLQLRPGLICYVLSGKDDLHQALLMGRRGAFGWIDKYVGTERLLALVADGLKVRPHGIDLLRLVATSYPQPVAIPFLRWRRNHPDLSVSDRLVALRELFEAIVSYLGAAALAVYLNRGLLEDEINAGFLRAVEKPTPQTWLHALDLLLPRAEAPTPMRWWRRMAHAIRRPTPRADLIAEAVRVIGDQTVLPSGGSSRSLFDLFSALASFHDLWLTPQLFPPADAEALSKVLAQTLEHAMAELSLLADVELCWVAQAIVTADGDYDVSLDALTGESVHNRRITSATPLRRGDLYLISRVTHEPLANLGPMMIYGRCEVPGVVSSGVFTLAQVIPDRRALYLSYSCGHVRWIDSPATLDAIRHLHFALDPRGERSSHLLRNVAVGLFDLSGFTTLTREQGPTVARELVRRMVAIVRESARSQGGTTGEPVGDEVLVYFDNPQAAITAAVEAMRSLAQHNERNPQATLHIHVGLDYGPGIVERTDVWGDVINRAKRCQSMAAADEIVISAELASAIGTLSPFTLQEKTGDLKGFGQAKVYKVQW